MVRMVRFAAFGGPEVLHVEEAPAGEPGEGEVRIRVDAFGLNRAEALFRAGTYGEKPRAWPASLGYEAAGAVEAAGPGVAGLAPGTPVSTVPAFSMADHQVYGESAVVPARAVVERPDGVDAVAGAAVWMAFVTAYGGLIRTGGLAAGDTALLTAASSSVGLAALQVARRAGATPIATTRSRAKRDLLLEAGAADVVVTGEDDLVERVRAATGGRGADVVLDAVGGPGTGDLMRATARGGRLVPYGALSGRPIELPALELIRSGVILRGYSVSETRRDDEALRRATAFVSAGLRAGDLRPAVDRVFDLTDIAEAHRYLESNAQVGKVVVTVPH